MHLNKTFFPLAINTDSVDSLSSMKVEQFFSTYVHFMDFAVRWDVLRN